jgi:hypothetical protein|tara:strand:+ start:472 stop:711 length:240 start_codon:yes stop_codon:yes gene_type:complete
MKLIDQVKPEVLDALAESKINYSSSYRSIIASLSSADRYRQLSIDQVDQLITFLPRELHPNGRTDFYYGDYLLQEKYKL